MVGWFESLFGARRDEGVVLLVNMLVVDALLVFESRDTMLDIPDDAVMLWAWIALQSAIARYRIDVFQFRSL